MSSAAKSFPEASQASPGNILRDGYRTQSGQPAVGHEESEKCQDQSPEPLQPLKQADMQHYANLGIAFVVQSPTLASLPGGS